MAGPDRIVWRRGFPSRAWGRLGWYVTLGATAVVIGYVLFGSESARLETGESNPLALIPTGLTIIVTIAATPFLLALFRRPVVAADHYALSIRPGFLRTLVLPWARIAEVAAYGARDEAFLLVRCANRRSRLGDRPRWWDRTVLRAAKRGGEGPTVGAYDLAVRMDEFVGDPGVRLASLAALAPRHVIVADDLV